MLLETTEFFVNYRVTATDVVTVVGPFPTKASAQKVLSKTLDGLKVQEYHIASKTRFFDAPNPHISHVRS